MENAYNCITESNEMEDFFFFFIYNSKILHYKWLLIKFYY
jgi:hypothetical protein